MRTPRRTPRRTRVRRAHRHHIAGVVHRHAHRPARVEAVFEARKRRVGVHQHRVEVAVGEPARAVVVLLLIAPRIDQDVAQAARDQRRRTGLVSRGADQRQDLAGELLAPERKQLHQQHRRAMSALCFEDQRKPARLRLGHVVRRVAADHRVAVVHAERRQVDQFDAGRHRQAGRQASAVQEHDMEALGQRCGQRERARQVADAQRVLAVEQQARQLMHGDAPPARGRCPAPASRPRAARTRPAGHPPTPARGRSPPCRCTRAR